ncbi:TrmB family transcriptional regulator [Candidatus Woesearchaeota archaeon]|nr:TrmB family transcriptional regulator [Candidatus Woesearchaeota archaeon]
MIMQKEILGKLRDFGLNSYEIRLWVALLSRGISTAGELSDIANVPRSRSYDVLESLEKKGFVMTKVGKPIKYIAVPPEEVFERVKKRIKVNTDERLAIIDNMKKSTVLDELNLLHSTGLELVEPYDLSGSLKGRENLYTHLETRLKNAKQSIVISTTAQGLIRKGAALRKALQRAQERGVQVKILTALGKENQDAAKELSKFAEIRSKANPARYVMIDGKEITFMLSDDKQVHANYDTGIWVNTPFFTAAIESMFQREWEGCRPYK